MEVNYPYEKLKLDRARIIKAIEKVDKDMEDLRLTRLYLIRELKNFTQVNGGPDKQTNDKINTK